MIHPSSNQPNHLSAYLPSYPSTPTYLLTYRLPTQLSTYTSIYKFQPIHLSTYVPHLQPTNLPTYQRIYPSSSLPIYICTRLPTYPPIKMFPRFVDAKGPGTVSEHLYITSDFEVVNWRTFCAIQLLILVTHLKKKLVFHWTCLKAGGGQEDLDPWPSCIFLKGRAIHFTTSVISCCDIMKLYSNLAIKEKSKSLRKSEGSCWRGLHPN